MHKKKKWFGCLILGYLAHKWIFDNQDDQLQIIECAAYRDGLLTDILSINHIVMVY